MPRLIGVFAGRTLTLLVLSCRGSNIFISLYSTSPKCLISHLFTHVCPSVCLSVHLSVFVSFYFLLLAHLSWRLIDELIVSQASVVHSSISFFKQHFLWSHEADPYQISHISIYWQGEGMMVFFYPDQIRTLVAVQLTVAIDLWWEKWKLAFIAVSLQIFWQKFYRNVLWVVLNQTYQCCQNL